MNEVEAGDGLVNGVADDHATATGGVRVVQGHLGVRGIAAAFRGPVGGRAPQEAHRRALAPLGCTARRITRADGAFDVKEHTSRHVHGRAGVDDQLGTFRDLDVTGQGVRAGPCFRSNHNAVFGLVVGRNGRDRHHAHHEGHEEEGDE